MLLSQISNRRSAGPLLTVHVLAVGDGSYPYIG